MLKFFTGSSTHRVDAKGRVSLPASFRKVLERYESTHVVVLPQLHHPDYHVAMSQAGHEDIVEQFEELELDDLDREALARQIVTNARQIPYDDTGRMVLTKDLRDQIGLADEVRFAGRGSFFQLWEPGKCDVYEADLDDRGRKLVPLIRLERLHR